MSNWKIKHVTKEKLQKALLPPTKIEAGQRYGTYSVFSKCNSKTKQPILDHSGKKWFVYVEFEVISVGDTKSVISYLPGTNVVIPGERITLKNTTILEDCIRLQDAPLPEVVEKKVIKTVKQKIEVYRSEYSDTWIDRWYNRYCERKGRNRPIPVENLIEEQVIEEL